MTGTIEVSPPAWSKVNTRELCQGDLLTNVLVPYFGRDLPKEGESVSVPLKRAQLIIVTQSCDLANGRSTFVALCGITSLQDFEKVNTGKPTWEEVRKGRREGLHMLPSPDEPGENRQSLVTDFRQLVSIPFEHLSEHAGQLGDRWRLQSPFLEHFSQSFGRFFMRIALPWEIPRFK